MNILVTGSKGFVGKNLIENLKNIRDGKNRSRPGLYIDEIYEYDVDTCKELLNTYCKKCDFVFHLAGVNRPKKPVEFMEGNFGFTSELLRILKSNSNTCPVMLSSSIQATLTGRYRESEYGKSKLAGENLFFRYAEETGAKVLVYRFPNLFGKWCKPNYNSVVATFCNAIANDLEYTVNESSTKLELLYIDDLVDEMLNALENKEHRCEYQKGRDIDEIKVVENLNGKYCFVPVTYSVTLQEIVEQLKIFKTVPETLLIPETSEGSFYKKLYATYMSYLPESKMSYRFISNVDERGSFTELIHTLSCGQVSVNITKPGVTKGQHWHNSKWEIFIVVSGHGLIQERKIGVNPETGKPYPVINFEVTGESIKAVQMLPGYTHNLTNLSETEDLITVMWANEVFDKTYPDTFFEVVE